MKRIVAALGAWAKSHRLAFGASLLIAGALVASISSFAAGDADTLSIQIANDGQNLTRDFGFSSEFKPRKGRLTYNVRTSIDGNRVDSRVISVKDPGSADGSRAYTYQFKYGASEDGAQVTTEFDHNLLQPGKHVLKVVVCSNDSPDQACNLITKQTKVFSIRGNQAITTSQEGETSVTGLAARKPINDRTDSRVKTEPGPIDTEDDSTDEDTADQALSRAAEEAAGPSFPADTADGEVPVSRSPVDFLASTIKPGTARAQSPAPKVFLKDRVPINQCYSGAHQIFTQSNECPLLSGGRGTYRDKFSSAFFYAYPSQAEGTVPLKTCRGVGFGNDFLFNYYVNSCDTGFLDRPWAETNTVGYIAPYANGECPDNTTELYRMYYQYEGDARIAVPPRVLFTIDVDYVNTLLDADGWDGGDEVGCVWTAAGDEAETEPAEPSEDGPLAALTRLECTEATLDAFKLRAGVAKNKGYVGEFRSQVDGKTRDAARVPPERGAGFPTIRNAEVSLGNLCDGKVHNVQLAAVSDGGAEQVIELKVRSAAAPSRPSRGPNDSTRSNGQASSGESGQGQNNPQRSGQTEDGLSSGPGGYEPTTYRNLRGGTAPVGTPPQNGTNRSQMEQPEAAQEPTPPPQDEIRIANQSVNRASLIIGFLFLVVVGILAYKYWKYRQTK